MQPPKAGTWERRAYLRIPLRLRVSLELHGRRCFLSEPATDISAGGMFVRTESPCEPGESFVFEARLSEAGPLLSGAGEVVWRRSSTAEAPGGIGARFTELESASRELLQRLANAYARDGTAGVERVVAAAVAAWEQAADEDPKDATAPVGRPLADTQELTLPSEPRPEPRVESPEPLEAPQPREFSAGQVTAPGGDLSVAATPTAALPLAVAPTAPVPTVPRAAVGEPAASVPGGSEQGAPAGLETPDGAAAGLGRWRPRLLALGAVLLVLAAVAGLWWRQPLLGVRSGATAPAPQPDGATTPPPVRVAVSSIAGAETRPEQGLAGEPRPNGRPPAAGEFRSVRTIEWREMGDGLIVAVGLDGSPAADRFHYFRLDQEPSRVVLELAGIARGFERQELEVGSSLVSRIRVGFHRRADGAGGDEQHLVFDLVDPRVRVHSLVEVDSGLELSFSR
jgi:uncharacterized protein (TIGR02266 family)